MPDASLQVGYWGTAVSALQNVIVPQPFPLLIKHIEYEFRGGAAADFFTLDVYPIPTNWPAQNSALVQSYAPLNGWFVFQSTDAEILLPPGSGVSMNCFLTGAGVRSMGVVWYKWVVEGEPMPYGPGSLEPVRTFPDLVPYV